MKIKSLVLTISSVLCTTLVWADNTVTTNTAGNYNTLTASQQGGDGNAISITQSTDNNQSSASQNGSGNSASVSQYVDNFFTYWSYYNNGQGVANLKMYNQWQCK